MPHADVKCSSDLDLDFDAIFAAIEGTIQAHDAGSGDCKCRAYPTNIYRHTHVLINLAMLTKPHRDDAFTQNLMNDLEANIKALITQDCFFSLGLAYNDASYVTNLHTFEGNG